MNFIDGIISKDMKFTSSGKSFSFTIPHGQVKNGFSDKEIVLGIRPEDIGINKNENYTIEFNSNVELVEPMGNEIFVYFKIDSKTWVSRTNTNEIPQLNQNQRFTLNTKKLYFFDKESGDKFE